MDEGGAPRQLQHGGAALDGAGNVYAVGTFVKETTNAVDRDWILWKYDAAGTRLWTRTWDDPAPDEDEDRAYGIAADDSGVVVVGKTGYGYPPPQTTLVTRRYDGAGNAVWESRYLTHDGDQPYALALDTVGRVTISATTNGGQAFVIRYDSGGVQTWAHAFPDAFSSEAPMAVDDAGAVWMASVVNNRTTVFKLAADGQETWRASYESLNSAPLSVAVRDGVCAVSGYGSVIARIDATGNVSWTRSGTTSTDAIAVALSATGNIVVAGASVGDGGVDFGLAVFDPGGTLAWERTYDGSPGRYRRATALVIGADGAIHVSGWSQGINRDVTTLKYGADGTLMWAAKEPAATGYDGFGRAFLDGEGGVIVPAYDYSDGTAELRRYGPGGELSWVRPSSWLSYWASDNQGGLVGLGSTNTNAGGVIVERYDGSGTKLWSRTSSSALPLGDSPIGVAVDPLGNTVTAICDGFDRTPTLAKYDRQGLLLWTRKPSVSCWPGSLAIDSSQAVYLATMASNGRGEGVLLSKFSPDGVAVWSRTWTGPSGTDHQVRALSLDAKDNPILAGIAGPVGQTDLWDYETLKYDRQGNLVWARTRDGSGKADVLSGMAIDGEDNVVVTGLSRGSGGYGALTVSYDPGGTERWSHFRLTGVLPRGEFTYGPAIATSLEGDSTLGTRTWNGTDFDLTIFRYDGNGNLLWTFALAGDPGGSDAAGLPVLDTSGAATVPASIWTETTASDGVLLHFPGHSTPRQYHTLSPCRVLDTRGAVPGGSSSLAAGLTRTVIATGACGIPETARALALNVTVTGATAAGNLRVFPGGFPVPSASNANYVPGQTRANNAVVGLGAGGKLGVLASQATGTLDVILDVSGYFE